MADVPSTAIDKLMHRFVGLTVDEGRAVYATLSPEQQAALDERGLKSSWRSMRASEARARRHQDIAEAAAKGERKPSKAMQRALEDARARKARRAQGGE
jgi:3-methyladenine DNA glycosylase/8-oxoguanine DNA glycosylase